MIPDANVHSFEERLTLSLVLTISGVEHTIAGGAVKRIALELDPYGFTGFVEFVLLDDAAKGGGFTDTLRPDFLSQASCDVHLEVGPTFGPPEAAELPSPWVLEGIARERSVVELQLRHSADRPVLARRYRLAFADPARVLWTQHFPCRLYTQKTLEDVIGDQVGDKVTMGYDWSVSSVVRPQWFVHLPLERGASFYDFVAWYADTRRGHFVYDYAGRQYALRGEKDTSAAAQGLFGDDIASVEVVVPPAPAHAPEIVNTYAEEPSTDPIENAMGSAGVRHDILLRSPIAQDTDERVALEKTRLVLPEIEVALGFARMPVIGLYPGLLVDLKAANRWSASSELVDKTWRVQRLYLRAEAPDGAIDEGTELAQGGYSLTLSAHLEQSTDLRRQLPAFRRPHYPGHVEGKVVSEKGEDGEKTYQSSRNETTSLDEYTVKVPAWSDQTVTAPFIPILGSGNLYLPCYRDERVLLALDLHDASIVQLLSWREGAALSMDVQGEQILLGISATSSTSLNHIYEEQKPVFNMARTSASDTQTITLSEGCMLLEVREQEE